MISTDTSRPSTSFEVSPHDILPVPKVKPTIVKRKNNRRKGSAAVLTSSLYKSDLITATEEKKDKEKRKKIKLELRKEKDKKKKEAKTKKVEGKKKSKVTNRALCEDSDDSDVSDADCLFCGDYFSKSRENEGWIRCSSCLRWAHEACAGCDEEDNDFICDVCK
ncbi:golgin imh1 [Lasius niger]|uniref:Golgin imh1 n=1 Tax=Lasius niger TaxID=67767 RepID=A0A0J7JUB4_LASNI|nr:golgin imh1 [Lasius niger]